MLIDQLKFGRTNLLTEWFSPSDHLMSLIDQTWMHFFENCNVRVITINRQVHKSSFDGRYRNKCIQLIIDCVHSDCVWLFSDDIEPITNEVQVVLSFRNRINSMSSMISHSTLLLNSTNRTSGKKCFEANSGLKKVLFLKKNHPKLMCACVACV